jgi:hypothetical protein
VLRYLILKNTDHILQKIAKKRLLFGTLSLEKETTVVAENSYLKKRPLLPSTFVVERIINIESFSAP